MSRILPILFNTEMVWAILDGRKTVTRRKIDIDIANQFDVEHDGKTVVAYIDQATGDSYSPTEICRYQPGDILYVRETWNYGYIETSDSPGNFEAWFEQLKPDEKHDSYIEALSGYFYKADEDIPWSNIEMVWRPSIHMPKQATRIWLKVADVRVERLQDIDDEGAKAEGSNWKNGKNVGFEEKMRRSSVERFAEIWDSTIKKADMARYSWDANPWVWVIEFERCDKPAPCIIKGIEPAKTALVLSGRLDELEEKE